jgi:flagellar biogenesis protein FliO
MRPKVYLAARWATSLTPLPVAPAVRRRWREAVMVPLLMLALLVGTWVGRPSPAFSQQQAAETLRLPSIASSYDERQSASIQQQPQPFPSSPPSSASVHPATAIGTGMDTGAGQPGSGLRSSLPPEAWVGKSQVDVSSPVQHANYQQELQERGSAGQPSLAALSAGSREGTRKTAPSDVRETASPKVRHRIPLGQSDSADSAATNASSTGTIRPLISMVSSLLVVLGAFFGLAWLYRKSSNSSMNGLPKQVVQVLGRTPLAARQNLVLIRFGSKLVLISLAQGETRTICEIQDPLEVDQIAGLCESQSPNSLSNSFKSILNQGGA